jgi:hypothetical protein
MMVAPLPPAQSLAMLAQPLVSVLDRKAELDLARAAIQTLELGCVQALLPRESCRRTAVYRPN